MKVVHEFNKALSLWFNDHGFSNLEFVEGEDFCYYPSLHTVQWGMFDSEKTDNHFRQFFHEYGMKNDECIFIISLLHEVGHFQTIHFFSNEEFESDFAAKENRISDGTIDTDYWYWELPIELAANMWAINWINEHPIEVKELYKLCVDHINQIMNDENVLEQVDDWRAKVKAGEYESLSIYEEDEED